MVSTPSWAVDDDAAVAEARSGNAEAFRALVDRHSRAVYRLAFRMTGNEHDAEDLVQETFLRAARQLHRFDRRASFGTWLFRIASNCSVDLLRSRKSRDKGRVDLSNAKSLDESANDPWERIAGSDPSPERLSMSNEVNRLLAPAMRQLTEMERSAFVLRHYEGWSVEEIGRALRVRPNAAKHSIFRAVQKLRRVLEPAFGPRPKRTAP